MKTTLLPRRIEGSIRRIILVWCLTMGAQIYAQNTISSRFATPSGYARPTLKATSFASYLRTHTLKPEGTPVRLYDGTIHPYASHLAVLDVSVGKRDLQQCADAVMRLRAEYLYKNKLYDQIQFHFTNGFLADYKKYRSGYKISVQGNTVSWIKTNKDQTTREAFDTYLQQVFIYAGTLSLSKELKAKNVTQLEIGDVFIQGGSPGHSIIVVDLCKNAEGKTKVMLAQSYMPAQSIHILQNPEDPSSPWFEIDSEKEYLVTPDWTFKLTDLKSF